LRVASMFAAMILVLAGILIGVRIAGSSGSEVAQVKEPAPAGGKAPEAVAKVEPAMAEILFERPVEVEEVLRIVGEENRNNLTTMEGSFRAGGEEISDFFSVPPRLETAEEIERAWAEARTASAVDMSGVPKGPVVEGPRIPQRASDKMDDEPRAQSGGMQDAMKDPGVGEILVTKASLQGSSLELDLLPAQQSNAIKSISVTTRSELMETFERVRKEAKRRGEPPPVFD
jgi:hypothetical protein